MTELICQNERQKPRLYGLDYLEVGADQRTLTAHFLGKAPEGIDKSNVLIEGGRRIRDIRVLSAETEFSDDPELDDTLEVVVNRPGDFSTYTLRIVARDAQGRPHPHPEFDRRYDSVEFSFKVDCPSDLDCMVEPQCPPVQRNEPEINYLAKDYASFRQLILDRLALVMPDWKERHVPDIGVALVDLFAYAGDYLSYYQDAVATEAYLDTARRRISVRRHARLVDYQMHEGCNARTWVVIETNGDPSRLDPRDTFFITGFDDTLRPGVALRQDELEKLPAGGYEIFEPMTGEPILLYESHNKIRFHTWGDDECCLDRGATSATLVGEWAAEDGLPFPLCISALGPPPECEIIRDISVARGNVVLADHGRTIEEELESVLAKAIVERCESVGAGRHLNRGRTVSPEAETGAADLQPTARGEFSGLARVWAGCAKNFAGNQTHPWAGGH